MQSEFNDIDIDIELTLAPSTTPATIDDIEPQYWAAAVQPDIFLSDLGDLVPDPVENFPLDVRIWDAEPRSIDPPLKDEHYTDIVSIAAARSEEPSPHAALSLLEW